MRWISRTSVVAAAGLALAAGPVAAAEWPSPSPTGLAQTAATASSITMTWNAVRGASVERASPDLGGTELWRRVWSTSMST